MAAAEPKPNFQFRLDLASGVPVYRQLIEQVRNGIAFGTLQTGDQLPTVRQTAVDLAINPNTVVSTQKIQRDDTERQRQLDHIVSDFVARARAAGFKIDELLARPAERKSAGRSSKSAP